MTKIPGRLEISMPVGAAFKNVANKTQSAPNVGYPDRFSVISPRYMANAKVQLKERKHVPHPGQSWSPSVNVAPLTS
jgi:hypothetical protein